jgi:Domain of unknown function (DUF5134)
VTGSLAVVFTVLFGATAVYYLLRCTTLWSGHLPGQDRAVELAHLLMSLAMIAMAWAWGGPVTRWLLVAVFGLFAAVFLARAVASGAAVMPTDRRTRMMFGYHALVMAAMTWMVAALPLLGHDHFAGAGGSGHEHGGSDNAQGVHTPVGEAKLWAVVVMVVLAVALAACAVAWVAAAMRSGATVVVGAGRAMPETSTPTAMAAHAVGDRRARWWHALMSVGMAGMLLAMV